MEGVMQDGMTLENRLRIANPFRGAGWREPIPLTAGSVGGILDAEKRHRYRNPLVWTASSEASSNRQEPNKKLPAIIEREGPGYVSLCPELDIASQGDTIEQARDNLQEALALFFECDSPDEVRSRLKSEVLITQVEVAVG